MNTANDPLEQGRPLPFWVAVFWVAVLALDTIFNSLVAQIDHPRTAAWEPWSWEWSSALLTLLLIPAVLWMERHWPLRRDCWWQNLPWHLVATLPFSLIHVLGMVGLRKVVYVVAGSQYRFGDWWLNAGYEYLKDVRSYFFIVALTCLSRLWRQRPQRDAPAPALIDRAKAAPDRPQRFLVRKRGKEFPISADEIEWLQACGNYVNLHVRGSDYPLRSTMASILEKLDPQRFLRVHRSYLLNLDHLVQIEPQDSGEARLHLRDGQVIPCSRRYRATLRERLDQASVALAP